MRDATIVDVAIVVFLDAWGRKQRKFNRWEVEGRTQGKGGSIWKTHQHRDVLYSALNVSQTCPSSLRRVVGSDVARYG